LKPRILIVDDHALLRRGIESIITRRSLGTVCGEAGNGEEAIRKVRELKPDLVIMDISMPKMGGIEATKQIRKFAPDLKIIILTMHDSRQMAEIAEEAGATRLIVKSEAQEELARAIIELSRDGLWMVNELVACCPG
jgi:DNA-binding NarL/FixJ family response regulator